jgi:hypothetical protein
VKRRRLHCQATVAEVDKTGLSCRVRLRGAGSFWVHADNWDAIRWLTDLVDKPGAVTITLQPTPQEKPS